VVIHQIGETAVRLRYTLEFDAAFTIASVCLRELRRGGAEIRLSRTESGRWLNESKTGTLLDGLDEIDIQATSVAYVAVVPALQLERQRYTRVATFDAARAAYVFESLDSDSRAVITVDAEDYVLDYEGLWTRV
jgi:hypothetical protein